MRTFSLGAGADVVKFTSKGADDANTIKNFGTTDKLSFLDTAFAGSKSATGVTTATDQLEITANNIYVGTKANIQSLKGASGGATNSIYVAVVTSGDGVGEIYAVNDKNSNNAAETTLIGTIDNVENLAFTNFGFFTAA